MQVNTSVVKALMCLRQVSDEQLAALAHVTRQDLHAWLYDIGESSEERVAFDTQLEILRTLGIAGEGPRADIVHYWRLHQPLFSRTDEVYWPLAVMVKAFGKAQAAYLARETDPAFTLKARSCFGLRFDGFVAILDVTAHPLRTISLDPADMPDLSWVPDTFGVILPDSEYDCLEPGAMRVRSLQQCLSYTAEAAQWDRLRDAALERGMRADEVAQAAQAAQVVAASTPELEDDLDLFATPVKAVN